MSMSTGDRVSRTFTKLFSSITESTVWCEPDRTRLAWICMLAMADRNGRVWGSVPGLANRARIPLEDARVAIATFLSPDHDSRTSDHEGRRIEVIDGGWRLLNHEKYRAIRDEESTLEAKRKYINTRRAKERESRGSTSSTVDVGRDNAEADAEAEANKEIEPSALVVKDDVKPQPNCPYGSILALYHAHCPSLPRVRVQTNMRMKHTGARWKQILAEEKEWTAEQALAWFGDYFKMAEASNFLTGRSSANKRAWTADFQWLMTAGNFAKVVEGKYHGDKA